MVVGNGLIATQFQSFKNDDKVLIFASGVSNSKETNNKSFMREKKMLIDTYKKYNNYKFIYFSTTSIFDKCLTHSKYVQHKKELEKYIVENFNNYVIFRLPIIASKSKNPNTLLNNFYNKIIKNENIEIYDNATRYIIDIDDVYKYVSTLICNLNNQTINICFDNRYSILQIIQQFELILDKSINITIISGGCDTYVDNKVFMSLIDAEKHTENYLYNIISKYYLINKA